jgi:PAS domain S-box-containing protein
MATAAGFDQIASVLPTLEAGGESADLRDRRLAALLAFGRRANAQPTLAVLIQDAMALVAESLNIELGGFAEIIAEGKALLLRIIRTESPAHQKPLLQSVPLGNAESLAAYTLHCAAPVVTDDLAHERRFSDLLLRNLGVVSGLTVPLYLGKQPLGTLGGYSRRRRLFTTEEVAFAETIGYLLTASIAREKVSSALQEARSLARLLLEAVDEIVIVLDAGGMIQEINKAAVRQTGFLPEQVRGKPFVSVFAAPRESELFQAVFRRIVNTRDTENFESFLLTKEGLRCRVAWSVRIVCHGHGEVRQIVLTGRDRAAEFAAIAKQLPAEQKTAGKSTAGERLAPETWAGVHRPFHPLPTASVENRRSSPRREFRYRQHIAPMHDERLPPQDRFFEVVCEDISAGGIAFYMECPPTFKNLVVALGKHPHLSYLVAEVVRVQQKTIRGQKVCLVGCQFTGKAQYEKIEKNP